MNNKAQVYLMKCAGFYKIGASSDPNKRLSQLNNRPFKTELITTSIPFDRECAYAAESDLLNYCKSYKIGGEWFLLPAEIVEIIKNAIEDKDLPYLYGETE